MNGQMWLKKNTDQGSGEEEKPERQVKVEHAKQRSQWTGFYSVGGKDECVVGGCGHVWNLVINPLGAVRIVVPVVAHLCAPGLCLSPPSQTCGYWYTPLHQAFDV